MRSRVKRSNGIGLEVVGVLVALAIMAVSGAAGVIAYHGFDWRELVNLSFYQNLANPSVRIVKVHEGWRKEQVAEAMAKKLGWSEDEKNEFINIGTQLAKNDSSPSDENSINLEGYYFPKSYMLNINANDPETVSQIMFNAFDREVGKIKKPKGTKVVNEETALKIASIIQREAGKNDHRLISGVIWNRIFAGMKLQMDATLQYAKGTEGDWWPEVESEDKYIESPYNTYKYDSLPPAPIANPGITAIEAAYNPQKTKCMFYLHDKKGRIHCSVTYKEHLKNIDRYY